MDVQVSGGARDGWQLFCYVPQIAWQENCYVAAVDGDCFLVDPGFDCEGVGAAAAGGDAGGADALPGTSCAVDGGRGACVVAGSEHLA